MHWRSFSYQTLGKIDWRYPWGCTGLPLQLEGNLLLSGEPGIVLCNLLKLYADLTFLSSFNVYREKLTTLEVSVAKCLDVLSTDLPSGKRDPLQLTGSTSERSLNAFPAWHVKYFLLKLRGVFRGGGLQKFITKELKVQYFFLIKVTCKWMEPSQFQAVPEYCLQQLSDFSWLLAEVTCHCSSYNP